MWHKLPYKTEVWKTLAYIGWAEIVAHRRCRNRQDIFFRLMTLTGRSLCGFSFYTMLNILTTLALVGSWRRVRLNVFCEVQQMVGGGRQDGGFKRPEKVSMIPHAADDEKGANRHLIYCIFSCIMKSTLTATISCAPGYSSATGMVTARTTFHC